MLDKETIEKIVQKFVSDNFHSQNNHPYLMALTTLLEQLYNQIMLSEREIFLQNLQESGKTKDKANGYYDRHLATSVGELSLSVPRVRSAQFRPHLLPPPYQRTHPSYSELLKALMSNGYSDAFLDNFFNSLNLPYSKAELTKIKQDLMIKVEDFKNQQLPSELFALFIDAYHTRMKFKGRIKNICLYVIAAISNEGKKIPIGFYIIEGAETKEKWLHILNDLINRGLNKVILVVSDDFPGLISAFKTLFPKADHQICYVHLQRNIRKNMGKKDAKTFNYELKKLRFASYDFETALNEFLALCERYENKYPAFIRYLKERAEHYLAFFKYPEQLRKFLYTTNLVENINRQIERIRINLGGYFQSPEVLEINVYLQFKRLENGRWRKGVPELKARQYELLQLFRQRYELEL